MDKLKEKVNTYRDERDAAATCSEEVKAENKKVQDELTAKEQENNSLTNRVAQLECTLDETLKKLKETTEKLREIDVKSENQERMIAKLENDCSEKETLIEEKKKSFEELKNEYDETLKHLDNI